MKVLLFGFCGKIQSKEDNFSGHIKKQEFVKGQGKFVKTLGIDIGTTSICVVLYDKEDEKIVKNKSAANEFVKDQGYVQDADEIVEKVEGMLKDFENDSFEAVGISTQMHGILYIDANGKAVSPFYTWKEECGKESYQDCKTYEEYLTEKTGYSMYSGYGSVTHFYMQERGRIPEKAVKFVNIGDYLAMCLTKQKRAVVNESIAASFGGFNLSMRDYDWKALKEAGIKTEYYPEATKGKTIVGFYQGKPVFAAIGDNQASFLGAVADREKTISVNVGTGSQVSVYSSNLYLECTEGVRNKNDGKQRNKIKPEIRPFPDGGYLYVGASLNGGKVYERLAAFFSEVCEVFVGKKPKAYEIMEKLAKEKEQTSLRAVPNLYGSRGEEKMQSGFFDLNSENFHPADFVLSFVKGMGQELRDLYNAFPEEIKKGRDGLVASGNGMRKNALMRKMTEEIFHLPVTCSEWEEEAAVGAARFVCEQTKDKSRKE